MKTPTVDKRMAEIEVAYNALYAYTINCMLHHKGETDSKEKPTGQRKEDFARYYSANIEDVNDPDISKMVKFAIWNMLKTPTY
jgi:hypothetical protein